MPCVDVNGVSLYYEVTGHGPPLVLAHGFACGLRMWDPQVNVLARSWRVVTYDVRGHGISEAPDDPAAYSQAISVADLRALLEHLKMRRASVGGLSMGGNIALNFALAHPDMVTALIVADTGAGSDEAADWVARSTPSPMRWSATASRPSPTRRWRIRCSPGTSPRGRRPSGSSAPVS